MNSRWLRARQTKYAAYATVYVIVILAIIVVANVLADRYNKSYDSTANKRYSLSDQTAKIVKGLKQPATITYYDRTSRLQQGKDLLDRYANLSPGFALTMSILTRTPKRPARRALRSTAPRSCKSGQEKKKPRA